MTVEELLAREAIRDTMARYTLAGDRLKEDAFVAVFTEDAVLESQFTAPEDTFRYVGRDEIRQWITRWKERPEGAEATHAASFVRHHLSTSLIELSPDGAATARTYWTAYTDIGPDHGGIYLDEFRKEGAAWLIAHRRIRMDWRAENSLFRTAITNTRGAE